MKFPTLATSRKCLKWIRIRYQERKNKLLFNFWKKMAPIFENNRFIPRLGNFIKKLVKWKWQILAFPDTSIFLISNWCSVLFHSLEMGYFIVNVDY